jgi:hypothetical protein
MVQLVLLAAKFLFLLVLYLFVFMVVRAISRDIRHVSLAAAPPPDPVGWGGPAGLPSPVEGGHRAWVLSVRESPMLEVGRALNLPVGSRLVIGRAPDAGLQLLDTFVSSRHAVVDSTPDGLVVEDLGSTNGTLVRGEPLTGPVLVGDGDQVAIGDTVFVVEAR